MNHYIACSRALIVCDANNDIDCKLLGILKLFLYELIKFIFFAFYGLSGWLTNTLPIIDIRSYDLMGPWSSRFSAMYSSNKTKGKIRRK